MFINILKSICTVICVVLISEKFGWAQKPREIGLGIVLGEPTGITGKLWLDPKQAVDAGVSFSFSDHALLYGDYLYHFAFKDEFKPYLGVGGLLFFRSENRDWRKEHFAGDSSIALGLKIPAGIEWFPAKVPVGVFLELAPGITIIPGTDAFIQGGIGARYYF